MPHPFDLLFSLVIFITENQRLAMVVGETIFKHEQVLKMYEIVIENRSYPSSPKVSESQTGGGAYINWFDHLIPVLAVHNFSGLNTILLTYFPFILYLIKTQMPSPVLSFVDWCSNVVENKMGIWRKDKLFTHCLISTFHCAAVSQSKTYQVAMERYNTECNTGYFFTIPKHACDKFSLSEQSFLY